MPQENCRTHALSPSTKNWFAPPSRGTLPAPDTKSPVGQSKGKSLPNFTVKETVREHNPPLQFLAEAPSGNNFSVAPQFTKYPV